MFLGLAVPKHQRSTQCVSCMLSDLHSDVADEASSLPTRIRSICQRSSVFKPEDASDQALNGKNNAFQA